MIDGPAPFRYRADVGVKNVDQAVVFTVLPTVPVPAVVELESWLAESAR